MAPESTDTEAIAIGGAGVAGVAAAITGVTMEGAATGTGATVGTITGATCKE